MAAFQQTKRWDEEYETTRARVAQARLAVNRTLSLLADARLNHDRADGLLRRADSMTKETQGQVVFAEHKLEEAQQNSANAKRKALPQHRWQADIRRWQAAADDAKSDLRRGGDDLMRAEKDKKNLATEIKERQAAVAKGEREIYTWQQKLQYVSKFGRGLRTATRSSSESQENPLAVTEQAAAALREVLERTDRLPDQAFRLTSGPDGGINLTLDHAKNDDHVISHESVRVLLVGPGLPDSLKGKTLDISDSPEGTQIVLSG